MANHTLAASGVAAFLVAASGAAAQPGVDPMNADGKAGLPPIRTLLLTGQSNHNWRLSSRLHAETLESTRRFDVTIADDPAAALTAKDLGQYQLIVLDYCDRQAGRRWSDAADAALIAAVKERGVGVAAIHESLTSFPGWTEYATMLGLVWGEGSGHPPVMTFDLAWAAPQHAVTKGLPAFTRHTDELYHGLVNPAKVDVHVLATALSPTEGGTGKAEPMAMTTQFGKGRVFSTTLGHVWEGKEETKASIADPQFKVLLMRGCEWAATGDVTLPEQWGDIRAHNELSQQEKAEGWTLLFTGDRTVMRGFKQAGFPTEGWRIDRGMLQHIAGKGGGDLVTPEEYTDFEFACDWKVAPGGNSGIIYHCTEDHTYSWETGPEMQILDDLRHKDSALPTTRAGTLYALTPLAFDVSRPAGEWNHARVVMRGSKVEHWLNGFKVVEMDFASDEYKKAHDASKFKDMPDFGKRAKGHIALQDHGDDVWFRNIKVRALPAK